MSVSRTGLRARLVDMQAQLAALVAQLDSDADEEVPAEQVRSVLDVLSEQVDELREQATPPPGDDLFGSGLLGRHYPRFGRQLILRDVGRHGQERLARSAVLVVGAGGTGSTALLYLAAMGVGRIGLVDGDVVEENNLHRQVIHDERAVGQAKVASARRRLTELCRWTRVDAVAERLTADNAERLAADYQLIVDCTDNVASRYLLNDVAVVQRKPLVSASALRTDAQLHLIDVRARSPCYRCLYPQAASAAAAPGCSDAGVLGVVPGIVGCLAALEAVKLLMAVPAEHTLAGRVLLFDGLGGERIVRVVRLKSPLPDCRACGPSPTITSPLQPLDYPDLHPCPCPASSSSSPADTLPPHVHLSPAVYHDLRHTWPRHRLVDVRNATQFAICSLPGAHNVQLSALPDYLRSTADDSDQPIVFVCRRGRLSTQALLIARDLVPHRQLFHIQGGLTAYHSFDNNFPLY